MYSLGQFSKFLIKFPLTSRQRTGAGDNYIIQTLKAAAAKTWVMV